VFRRGKRISSSHTVSVSYTGGDLDETQRRIIEQSLAGMRLSGVGLSGDAKVIYYSW